ncbi:MAG TPA: hypothetical protein VD651_01300 [Nitrosarchaeum sp.]|nr:hypothetical protein [Nitrosarchaeum sp.]
MKKTLAISIGIGIIVIVIGVVAYATSNIPELKIEGPPIDGIQKGKTYNVTLTETLGAKDKGP